MPDQIEFQNLLRRIEYLEAKVLDIEIEQTNQRRLLEGYPQPNWEDLYDESCSSCDSKVDNDPQSNAEQNIGASTVSSSGR